MQFLKPTLHAKTNPQIINYYMLIISAMANIIAISLKSLSV